MNKDQIDVDKRTNEIDNNIEILSLKDGANEVLISDVTPENLVIM